MRANGNTVLITGGASGIGLALAELFLAAGNSVVVCGRDPAKLDRACARLPGLAAIRAYLTDPAARAALAHDIRQRFPALNVLVNNAGSVQVCDLTDPSHVEVLEREVAVNLLAPVALTSLLLPMLRQRPGAAIVNITSGYVFLPSARTAPYSAAKAGVHVMTRGLRFQLRGSGIRVVEVMPPAVDTAMATHYSGPKLTTPDAARQIFRGLLRGEEEIVIGLSRLARLLSRLAPATAFAVMNRLELRPVPAVSLPHFLLGRRRAG
ncbi:MAG TPA: SDR family NAD(P)-dependent oxidoreductase [Acetobacteraceae bacterium]|nr:SDR family NAD(P)-dependent oxidoreductase [Acetobacteraceae bacterium]